MNLTQDPMISDLYAISVMSVSVLKICLRREFVTRKDVGSGCTKDQSVVGLVGGDLDKSGLAESTEVKPHSNLTN